MRINPSNINIRVSVEKESSGQRAQGGKYDSNVRAFRIGEVVNGSVISVSERGLVSVRTSDGSLVNLSFGSLALDLEAGDSVSFKIRYSTGSEYGARLMDGQGGASSEINRSILSFLKEIDEKPTEANKSIVASMLEFDIPVNKSNFKEIKGDAKAMTKMADMIAENTLLADEIDVRADVKSVISGIFEGIRAMKASAEVRNTVGILLQNQDGTQPEAVVTDVESNASSAQETVKESEIAPRSSPVGSSLGESVRDRSVASALQAGEALNISDTPHGEASDILRGILNKEEAVDALEFMPLEKAALLKKMSVDSSVLNMVGLDKLILGKRDLIDMFAKIADVAALASVDGASSMIDELRSRVGKFSDTDITDVEGNLKALSDISEHIEKASSREAGHIRPDNLLNEVRGLRDSYEFLKNVSESLIYCQLPIKYETSEGKLEIAYKKRGNGSSDALRIFISLDTANIGLVQSMIELKGRNMRVNFNVDDDVRPIFMEGFESLREALKGTQDGDLVKPVVEIGFYERKDRMTAMDLFKTEVPIQSGFEIYI